MTEYDYSPEAYTRARATDKRIRNWRDMCDRHTPEFGNPFMHTPSSYERCAASPASSQSSLVDSTYGYEKYPSRSSSRHRSRSKKPRHKDSRTRSKSMSCSNPQQLATVYDYASGVGSNAYIVPGYESRESRPSSRHHRHHKRDSSKRRDHSSAATTPVVTTPVGSHIYSYTSPYATPVTSPVYTAPGHQQSYFAGYPQQQFPQQQQQQYYANPSPQPMRSNSAPLNYMTGQPVQYSSGGGSIVIVPHNAQVMTPQSSYPSPTGNTKQQPWFKRILGMGSGNSTGASHNSSRKGTGSGRTSNKIRSRRQSY